MRLTGQQWRRRNSIVDEGHRARRSPATETGRIPEQPIGDASSPPSDRHLVAAALGRLPREHRDVLRELCLRGRSVAQAADVLGIAPDAVKSRTYYALRALRLAIEELRGPG